MDKLTLRPWVPLKNRGYVPSSQDRTIIEIPSPVPYCRAFIYGECRVIVGREPAGKGGRLLWHLSIQHRDRYPTWDEIRDARYEFVPDDVTMAMLLPPRAEYVNVHPNLFHLWEVEDLREGDA